MYQGPTHPLDKLINDNSLVMLEAMVPFVDYQMKKLLIIYIKYREITVLMNCLNDVKYVTDCGFNCNITSQEDMIKALCNLMPGDFASSISNAQNMMSMMKTMNAFEAMNNAGTKATFNPGNVTSTPSDNKSLYESVLNIINESENINESDRQSQFQTSKSDETANNLRNN